MEECWLRTGKAELHITEFNSVFSTKQNPLELEKHGTNTVEEKLNPKFAEEPVKEQPGVLNVQSPDMEGILRS